MFSREECLELALEEVTDKQSGFRREEVIGHAMKAGLGHYTAEEFTRDFENHRTIQELGAQMQFSGRTQSAEVTFYTTDDILKTEAGIIKWAEDGRGKSNIAVSGDMVQSHVDGH